MKKVDGYKVRIVKTLKAIGFPTSSKFYREAHAQADNAERRANPKMYHAAAKAEKKLSKNELMGKNFKTSKVVEVEKKFKKLSPTIIRHEITENKAIKRKMQNRKK